MTLEELAARVSALDHAEARELVRILMGGRVSEVDVSDDRRLLASVIRLLQRRDLHKRQAAHWAYYTGRAHGLLLKIRERAEGEIREIRNSKKGEPGATCALVVESTKIDAMINPLTEDAELIALEEAIDHEYRNG